MMFPYVDIPHNNTSTKYVIVDPVRGSVDSSAIAFWDISESQHVFTHDELHVIEMSIEDMRHGRVRDLPDNWAKKILDQLSDELDDDF